MLKEDKLDETGRSMVEILGVLSVMGVLSVGGIAGYSVAMNKYRANELLNEASKRAVLVATQAAMGQTTFSLNEFGNQKVVGADLGVISVGTNQFAITVSKMSKAVCTNILNGIGKNTAIRRMTLLASPESKITTCNDNETGYALVYNDDLSTTAFPSDFNYDSTGGACETAGFEWCSTLSKCIKTGDACGCDAGYYLDGTECKICSAGTYAAAGASSCTPCQAGYTSPAGSTSAAACERDWNCNTDISLATDEAHFCNENCLSGCTLEAITTNKPFTWGCNTRVMPYTCQNGSCFSSVSAQSGCMSGCCSSQIMYGNDYPVVNGRDYYLKNTSGCHPAKTFCACFTPETPIALADGTCKRADEITYEDELLCWNFDEGKMDASRPIWIQKPMVSPNYNYMRFSDGSVLKTINQHRIFNREAGKFTYPMTDDTPIGTHTLNAKGEWVTLVEKKVVEEEVTYYNIITYHHINCFAGNVLTSCRLNNIYPIQDLKFVKDNRTLVGYEHFKEVDRKWYDGLRLAEQPEEINHKGDVVFDKSLIGYVQRLIKNAQ